MRFCIFATVQFRNGKRINIELGDLVAVAYQVDELLLGSGQGGVRHHVQKADMQFTDVLLLGAIE